MEPDKLRKFKEYGESILLKLDQVSQQADLQADWVPASLPDCIESLRKAAEKTVERADSPVKIGVMGEFSSGKTLLLGSMLGYANALPVSEIPTTGNVTAIHLEQQEGLQTTRFENFRVEYLDRQEVRECLRYMMAEAESRATAVGVMSANTLRNLNPTDPGVWPSIRRWCESAWNSTQSPKLRYLIRELMLFASTCEAYGEALGGKSYQIDAATAQQGLTLPPPPLDIRNLSFKDILPPALVRLPQAPAKLMPKLLQLSFLLLRRVDVEVKVSKDIWNLSNWGDNKFILLDFPGLGADDSGIRDTFLSLRELQEVQTILILLNGRRAGSGTASEIYSMMEQQRGQDLKDRILAGVGRFDQLPLDSEKSLDELIDHFVREPLRKETVLEKLNVLRTTIASTRALTAEKDRSVLLSPMLGLADLAKRSSQVKIGSEEFLSQLNYPGKLDESKRMRDKWRQLSVRLLESDSRSTLGRQLGYFAQDGGIGRLRELLQKHVADHGLKQVYEDTRRAAGALRQQQEILKDILEEIHQQGIPTASSQDFTILRQALVNLVNTYDNFKNDLGKKPLQDTENKAAVSDVVYDDITFRMFNWTQWNLLFNKTKNGTLVMAEAGGAARKIFGSRNKNDNSIPTKSEDFYPAFAQTLLSMENFARERMKKAVVALLNKLSTQEAAERESLKEILRPEIEEQLQLKFRSYEPELFSDLHRAAAPIEWKDAILEEIGIDAPVSNQVQDATNESTGIEDKSRVPLEPDIIFPLARADNNNKIGLIFDWSPEKKQPKPTPANHQILVLRLRDEMIASAALYLSSM